MGLSAALWLVIEGGTGCRRGVPGVVRAGDVAGCVGAEAALAASLSHRGLPGPVLGRRSRWLRWASTRESVLTPPAMIVAHPYVRWTECVGCIDARSFPDLASARFHEQRSICRPTPDRTVNRLCRLPTEAPPTRHAYTGTDKHRHPARAATPPHLGRRTCSCILTRRHHGVLGEAGKHRHSDPPLSLIHI